jgi:predicted acylesterase/phospholipase RssA
MTSVIPNLKTIAAIFLFANLAIGCVQTVNHRPLSVAEYAQTDFSKLSIQRFWGDEAPANVEEKIKKEAPALRARFPEAVNATPETAPLSTLLAISGGGANGAFGVGLLTGWSESGKRPKFDVVTGVSTGAIIAPFAYLGTDFDPVLFKVYSSVTQKDIYLLEPLVGLFGSALSDTTPLKKLLEVHITPQLVEAIAEEYRQTGRKLFIVTTHFDAGRPMVWDISLIATGRGENAVPLIRQIILASASIPGLFPPVPIELEIDGKRFTELHVDGGVSGQVFAYPAQIPVHRLNEILGLTFRRRIFLIQNGNAQNTYEPASVKIENIVQRTLEVLLRNQENSNIVQIYYQALRDGLEFKMISIPDTFMANRSTEFDTDYMRTLMEIGLEIGRRGNFWQDHPPAVRSKP